MINPWATVAYLLLPLEGVAGMLTNVVLLYYLASANTSSAGRLYYISCIVSAIYSFITSLLILVTVDIVAFIDGLCIAVLYGPLLQKVSPWVADALLLVFAAQLLSMWQILPAPSIIQWLSLSDYHLSSYSIIVIAYSAPLSLYILGWFIFFPNLLPTEDLQAKMMESISRFHGTNTTQFRVYGFPFIGKVNLDDITLADEVQCCNAMFFYLLPTYAASYALLGICTLKIRKQLLYYGSSISSKTAQMQRHFWRTHIAQGFLPLLLMSPSLVLVFFALLIGKDLRDYSAIVSFLLFPTPACTALLLLRFVLDAAVIRKQSHVSNTTIVTVNQKSAPEQNVQNNNIIGHSH